MSARSILRATGWLAGSAFALLIANLILIVFVSGTDIFLGQAPQLMGPLFAVIVSSGAVVLVHRSSVRVTQTVSDQFETRAGGSRDRRLKSAPRAPAYNR